SGIGGDEEPCGRADAGRLCNCGTCPLEQEAVRYAGRADGLAGAAAEAAVDVRAERLVVRLQAAFHDRAHEVEATARRVALVAQARIRRAGVQAEAAMHAREQSSLLAFQFIYRSANGFRVH